ncbi:MAG: COG4315 family predicted lipoprotein [Pseudonocardia sp.]
MTPSLRTGPHRLALLVALLVALGTAALSGCGGPEPATTEPAPTLSGADTIVSVADSELGRILVGQQGRTLYTFAGAAANPCTGPCLAQWPAYVADGVPYSADQTLSTLDVDALGTVARPDGTQQVTYEGMPLHYHAADQAPGAVAGQGTTAFDRTWQAVTPAGTRITR